MSDRGLRQFFRDELNRHAQADWSELAAVPSTATWRAVAHFRGLPKARRAHLFTVLESMAVSFFCAPYPGRDVLWQDEEYKRLVTAMVGADGYDQLRYAVSY